jgi:AAA domain, putative AbiEii toxin, Type IV TA system/Protein of unknown function (DUF4435)
LAFNFSIPTPSGPVQFSVESGMSILFVGANGGGKTRLAVRIEDEVAAKAHRISAHRALNLNPTVPKISENIALNGLRTGHAHKDAHLGNRIGSRWGSNAATSLLNDFDFLVQALFAEQANVSLISHQNLRAGTGLPAQKTKFESLIEIWDRILPHRKLHISGDDILASVSGATDTYTAAGMSDGERAIFYLIGQTLTSAPNSLIIVDEPELHIHRSIMSRLWDELEAARPDCGTVIISHDLEFVASREGQKYVLREYTPATGWVIEPVPEDTGFTEEITTLILGSRKPVLFVEGQGGSLDQAIYRACYPDWTIIPRGACEEVIHAVVTMRANVALTRIKCAGIVDADAYSSQEIQFFQSKGISVLPVAEIENLLLLPSVISAVAAAEGFSGTALTSKITAIFDELFKVAADPKNQLPIVMQYCRRRIDRTLKKIDLSDSADVAALAADYSAQTASLAVNALAVLATASISKSITDKDVPELLKWYENKGVLALAARAKGTKKAQFEQWVVRSMRNGTAPTVTDAIKQVLPPVVAA